MTLYSSIIFLWAATTISHLVGAHSTFLHKLALLSVNWLARLAQVSSASLAANILLMLSRRSLLSEGILVYFKHLAASDCDITPNPFEVSIGNTLVFHLADDLLSKITAHKLDFAMIFV